MTRGIGSRRCERWPHSLAKKKKIELLEFFHDKNALAIFLNQQTTVAVAGFSQLAALTLQSRTLQGEASQFKRAQRF